MQSKIINSIYCYIFYILLFTLSHSYIFFFLKINIFILYKAFEFFFIAYSDLLLFYTDCTFTYIYFFVIIIRANTIVIKLVKNFT